MVLLAENTRIPVDNPATHLELTMIHEALVLEYSARHLALIEWAAALSCSITPASAWRCSFHGASRRVMRQGIGAGGRRCSLKLAIAGGGLALIETVLAKMRMFRAPEFLATAFLLAVLGLLVRLLLGAEHARAADRRCRS